MKKTNNNTLFEGCNIKQLHDIKAILLSVETKEELLSMLDETLSRKEEEQKTSMNARLHISKITLDPAYQQLLLQNGITNVAQLRAVEDLRQLPGMTEGAYEEISWARDFFDMTNLEKLPPIQRTTMHAAKVIVKEINRRK